MYVKTHKTGSSTLTNIFHRFAFKHNLKVVLPKSNVFLGWPRSAGIPTSYVPLPGAEGNYDIFCSAHTRYSRKYIEPIVPNAHYITIFREPTSHFKSSWSYWDVPGHILRQSNMRVSMEEFLDDPDTWFPRGLKGDRDLLHNSFAFDFGYDHEYTQQDVDDLIAHLDTFTLVLITEYMDESLVLMKRKLCWELEDVVYFALKVNKRKPKTPMAQDIREKILKLNWFDAQLYTHFNRTLWQQIEREPNFDEELAAFRDLKAQLSNQCSRWASWHEDQHRKALLEEEGKALSVPERQCHLAQMDSVAFVKFLKQKSGVPDAECSTQGQPKRKVVYVKTHKTGSSTLTNILHRLVHKYNLRPVLPKNDIFLGYPNKEMLMSSYVKLPPVHGKDVYDVLCSAHSIYDRHTMSKLVPDAHYITVLRDPATHFVSSWNYWHTGDHIKARTGKDITMDQFIDSPDTYRHDLSEGDHHLLHNSMAYDLGLSNNPTTQQVEQLVQDLNNRFAAVIITEYFDESLIMLRRQLCWPKEDILYLSLKVSKTSKKGGYEVPAPFRAKVEKYNWADARLYHALNSTLWHRIHNAIGFKQELEWLQREKERIADLCGSYAGWGDNMHRKALMDKDAVMDEDEELCHLMMLDSPGFVKMLKAKHNKPDPECHNQPRERRSLAFSAVLPTPHGLAVANLLHRYRLLTPTKAVVPAREHVSFGWPDVSSADAFRARVSDGSSALASRPQRAMVVGVDAPLDKSVLSAVITNPYIVAMVASPVVSLATVWLQHDIATQLQQKMGREVSFGEFARLPSSYMDQLPDETAARLRNPMARALGFKGTGSHREINAFMRDVTKAVGTILIADHFYESVVHLRRVFCWAEAGLAAPAPSFSVKMERDVQDPEVRAAVDKFNVIDASIFNTLNSTFFRRLQREVSLKTEISSVKARTASFGKDCAFVHVDVSKPLDDGLEQLLSLEKAGTTSQKRRCLSMAMPLDELEEAVRRGG